MSGHSKWSKVKHQKATTDVVKGAAFTKASRVIMVAVREGAGITDPEKNFRLRLALEKARAVNMPKDTINRAIEKATGAGAGEIEQITYEGYGPGGVAFLIEATTDNRNRTVSIIKNTFERFGGRLAAPGAVSFLFSRKGLFLVPKGERTMDTLLAAALVAGADDVQEVGDTFEVYCDPASLFAVKEGIEKQGIPVEHTELIMYPKTTVETEEDGILLQLDHLIEAMEALDDVQRVYINIKEGE